jgi:hypothetical protein
VNEAGFQARLRARAGPSSRGRRAGGAQSKLPAARGRDRRVVGDDGAVGHPGLCHAAPREGRVGSHITGQPAGLAALARLGEAKLRLDGSKLMRWMTCPAALVIVSTEPYPATAGLVATSCRI